MSPPRNNQRSHPLPPSDAERIPALEAEIARLRGELAASMARQFRPAWVPTGYSPLTVWLPTTTHQTLDLMARRGTPSTAEQVASNAIFAWCFSARLLLSL